MSYMHDYLLQILPWSQIRVLVQSCVSMYNDVNGRSSMNVPHFERTVTKSVAWTQLSGLGRHVRGCINKRAFWNNHWWKRQVTSITCYLHTSFRYWLCVKLTNSSFRVAQRCLILSFSVSSEEEEETLGFHESRVIGERMSMPLRTFRNPPRISSSFVYPSHTLPTRDDTVKRFSRVFLSKIDDRPKRKVDGRCVSLRTCDIDECQPEGGRSLARRREKRHDSSILARISIGDLDRDDSPRVSIRISRERHGIERDPLYACWYLCPG